MFNRLPQSRFASTQKSASQVAQDILEQLGGAGKLRMMTGAKNLVLVPNGLEIHIPRSPKGVSVIRIVLTGLDLYDLTFFGAMDSKTLTRKIKSTQNDVYDDQLRPIVEQHTGLYLSLGRTANAMSDTQEDIIAILGGRQNMASLIGDARILPSSGDKGIIFAIPYVRGQGVTHIKIVLNDLGFYDVTFFAPMSGATPKVKKALKNVSTDTLLSVIKKYAYLSF